MATPTIPNGEEHFFTTLYEGNGGGQRVGKFVPFTDNGTIDNSCIFNDGDSPQLQRTPSSDGNRQTWTWSGWIKKCENGDYGTLFEAYKSGSQNFKIRFENTNTIRVHQENTTTRTLLTNRTFEDTSKWYNIVLIYDSTQATSSDRMRLYVDGDRITSFSSASYPGTDELSMVNSTEATQNVGWSDETNGLYFDGYMAEINFIDGTALEPSNFGVTDTSTGRWIPKTLSGITYGTNGFRLTFQNNSAVANLGYDYQTSDRSGTTNDFTVTNLATTDQTTDSPTLNFPTLSPLIPSGLTTVSYSEGNLKATFTNNDATESTIPIPSSGKWYFEGYVLGTTYLRDDVQTAIGLRPDGFKAQRDDVNETGFSYGQNGKKIEGDGSAGTASSYGASYSADDIIGVAVNMDSFPATLTFYKNNATQGTAFTFADKTTKRFVSVAQRNSSGWILNFGQNSTFFGENVNANDYGNYVGASDGNGVGNFFYTPPTGFLALAQDNLPETAKGISGLVWTKNRDAADNHQLYDSSRGKQLVLSSNTTDAESTVADGLQKFLVGGQQIEDSEAINTIGESFVSWNWVANGGTTESISVGGDIDIASVVQKNTTAGFSIVQYTGNGSSNQGIGHGLSVAPRWIIIKELSSADSWNVWHGTFANTEKILLDSTGAKITGSTAFGSFTPTSSIFKVNGNNTNASSTTYVAYVWNEIDGFSKFGSYTGNSDSNGPFIYTGFTPRFLMIKRTSTTGSWFMYDTIREPLNPVFRWILADDTLAENSSNTTRYVDILSNGFKLRATGGDVNSGTLIYMAFAEHPFVGDGTNPVTAR